MQDVEVRLDDSSLRRWHVDLLTRLSALPDVHAHPVWTPCPSDAEAKGLALLMFLERLIHGLDRGSLAAASLSDLDRFGARAPSTKPELVLDLTRSPGTGPNTWRVLYDGHPGTDALTRSLRRGCMPLVTIVDESGRTIADGRPGSDRPGLLASELPDVLVGVTTLIVGAVAGQRFAPTMRFEDATAGDEPSLPRIVGRRAFEAVRHRVYRALFRAPHWRVGWRFTDGDALTLTGARGASWRDLDDDGYHFYADPFPFEHDGRLVVFVEDFDHRLGRGVISVVDVDERGPVGTPRPVLEHDVHLSYPFVLEHDGEIWMIPETSEARTVELYRAVDFPEVWEREAVLLTDVEASDATPFQHDGRWWLMATVGAGGSLSDSLHLWSAPDLRGPWSPHRSNPVLVDIASARPAGRVVQRDGRLLRPAQDCRNGYGSALTVAEITTLDEDAFEQRLVGRLGPSEHWPGRRLHTLNHAGRLEVIDGSRLSPRFTRRRRRNNGSVSRDQAWTVQREDDLDFLSQEYSDLFDRSDATPFQHGVWLHHLYSTLAPRRRATKCVLTVRRAATEELVLVLPLVRRRQGPIRMIEYADLGVADYAAPVLDRGAAEEVRRDPDLARRILEALGAFDLFRVERVADSPLPLQGLIAGARSSRHLYDTHLITMPSAGEDWRDALSPKFARHLKKAAKRLRAKGPQDFRSVEDPAEVDSLMRLLQSFRSGRFSDRRAVDLVQDPDCFDFYCAVARDGVAGRGPARLSVLELDDTPVALALDLVRSDLDVHLLVGYDTGVRNCSLGLTIVELLIDAAVSRGQSYFDLTVGDEPYKADFGARARPLFEVYVPRTPAGTTAVLSRSLYLRGRRRAKHLVAAWTERREAAAARSTEAGGSPSS